MAENRQDWLQRVSEAIHLGLTRVASLKLFLFEMRACKTSIRGNKKPWQAGKDIFSTVRSSDGLSDCSIDFSGLYRSSKK